MITTIYFYNDYLIFTISLLEEWLKMNQSSLATPHLSIYIRIEFSTG